MPVVSLVYIGRTITATRPSEQKSRKKALDEANEMLPQKLPAGFAYKLNGERWGYRAAPAHCDQQEMYLVYQFEFVSTKQGDGSLPITIEIPAHDLRGRERIEDTWTCLPE